MRRRPACWIATPTIAVLVAVLAGCSSDSASEPPPTLPQTSTTQPRLDDGVLKLGVLVPNGSASADIGESLARGVNLAIERINTSGGYGGAPVDLMTAEESVGSAGGDPAIKQLLDGGVDAIVGPASSLDALAGLGHIVDAGVVACSPTASAALLDDFPDNGLFFRTIPSDSLQAMAIAEAVDRTGASQATVAYIDDDYGQRFADNVQAALTSKGIGTTEMVPYSPNKQSITTASTRVAEVSTGVVVILADATSGPVLIEAIDAAAPNRPSFIVNDAMRRAGTSAQPFPLALATRVNGISPVAYSADEQFVDDVSADPGKPSPYAGNAYDCVNLIALAALAAGSTQPSAIAAMIPFVSEGGTPCMSFAGCRTRIEAGSNVNYEGESGSDTMSANGDLSAATFEIFGFDQSGRDIFKGSIPVRR